MRADVSLQQTPDGVEYGLWGKAKNKPAPILFVLAGDIGGSLKKTYFRQCGNALAEDGFLCVSIDLPCHGKHTAEGKPSGLGGWRQLAEENADFVADNNERLTKVLDHLIAAGVADPKRIAACGTSRGGFLALHFAAHDPRIAAVAAFAPVTDLAALSEFDGAEDQPLVQLLAVKNQADHLAGRPVWIVIGDRDQRVDTQRAIEFAGGITAASIAKNVASRVELHVLPEPRGHTTPHGASGQAAAWIRRQFGMSSTVRSNAARTILLIDDRDVLYRAGTERVFHPAEIFPGNPVIKEDKPWEMAIGWTSILRHPDTGKFQLWYQAYAGGRDGRKTHKCVVCYAESEDGVAFSKPDLPLHDFNAQRQKLGLLPKTNIVLLGNDGYGDRYANSVLYDPDEPVSALRYKMLYTDFSEDSDGREWPGFHAAFSADGIRWTKSERNPLTQTAYGGRGLQPPLQGENVYLETWDARKNFLRKTWKIPISMSDTADVFFDPNTNTYAVYGKCWIQGPQGALAWKHAMARVDSPDFLAWSQPKIVAWPDDADDPNTEFHTSPVFFHEGVYFCLNQILRSRAEAVPGAKADLMHIELMISRDGLRWDRPFRGQPFIANQTQPFSNGGIFTNATPVILEDEIRFYYGGYHRGGEKLADPAEQSGVGFATIRRDRFAESGR